MKIIDSVEVYNSPEFKALCKLLGVAHGLPTRSITITLRLEQAAHVDIDHQYVAGFEESDRPVFVRGD